MCSRPDDAAAARSRYSARGITVSTVGLVPRIHDLAALGLPFDSRCRSMRQMTNCATLCGQLILGGKSLRCSTQLDYASTTGRRVSIEYALIRDINDQAWRADLLADRLRGKLAHVNLIPLNPTPGSKWTASRPEDEREFVRRLEAKGIPVTVRDTRGREIDGACGQLAAAE